MAIPNYTYLKLKIPSPKGVITIEGSFEQAYYYKQDCITQAAMLITPYAPDIPGHDAGRVSAEEVAKTAWCSTDRASARQSRPLGQWWLDAGPSIQALGSPEGVDPIEVTSNLSL
jgi:hypothetical protein